MRIFLSHASAEHVWAERVAAELERVGAQVRLDRAELAPGDSFLRFMNDALDDADYCLLLWSRAAAKRPWVGEEWLAALHRSVQVQRAFLVAARLEAHPLPMLLRHRVAVDLFPDFAGGMQVLVDLFTADRAAERRSGRPLVPLTTSVQEAGVEVYVTSQLFGRTVALAVNPNEPAAMVVERFVADLGLPKQVSHAADIGFRLSYSFVHDGQGLEPARSLGEQSVEAGALLWLETELQPFAATSPIEGSLIPATFRGDLNAARTTARRALLAAIHQAGLGIR